MVILHLCQKCMLNVHILLIFFSLFFWGKIIVFWIRKYFLKQSARNLKNIALQGQTLFTFTFAFSFSPVTSLACTKYMGKYICVPLRNWSSMAHKNNSRCRHFASTWGLPKKKKEAGKQGMEEDITHTHWWRADNHNEMSALTIKWLQCGWWWFWLDPSDLFQVLSRLGREWERGLGTQDRG